MKNIFMHKKFPDLYLVGPNDRNWYKGKKLLMCCKFENFRHNFTFANSDKKHICGVKKSQLWHDLPLSVNNIMISQGFYFHETSHMRSFAKIKPSQKFPNLQYTYPFEVVYLFITFVPSTYSGLVSNVSITEKRRETDSLYISIIPLPLAIVAICY